MDQEAGKHLTSGFWVMLGFFIFAVWLISPFFKIDASDYDHAGRNTYRFFLGLLILLIELGILAFDTFAPQGLARRVSNLRAVSVIVFGMLILALIIFIVAQAAVLYLKTGSNQI